MNYSNLTQNEKLAHELGAQCMEIHMRADINILKDCVKVLIRWSDPDMKEDIAKMKIDDEDKACDSYKKDFRKIMECLIANPDLQIK